MLPGCRRPLRTILPGRCRARRPRRPDHEAVVGDPEAGRAQAVAVEDRAGEPAVGEDDRRRGRPRAPSARRGTGRRPGGRGPSRCGSPTLRGSSSRRRGAGCDRRGAAARAPRRRSPSRWRPGSQIGKSRCRSPGMRSRPEQRLAGPHPVAVAANVLISPLWANSGRGGRAASRGRCWSRSGSARAPSRTANRSSDRSGKNVGSCAAVSMPL